MKYILILICALLSCTKVTIQGYVAKGNIKNSSDSVFLNFLIFAFTSLVFSVSLKDGINPGVIIYAFLFGLFSSSFQIFYALALKSGPFSATCMLVNLSMLIPVIFSTVFFKEKVTATKITGMVLCLFALFLNMKRDSQKINGKWIIYVFLAFFSTGGGISTAQKVFAKSQYSSNVEQFVFFGYLIAFLITGCIVVFYKFNGTKFNFKASKKNIFLVFLIAASLGAYQYFKTTADSIIDAIVLVPSISGLSTTLQMLSGRMIFKEKFTPRQILSISIGVFAILVISI